GAQRSIVDGKASPMLSYALAVGAAEIERTIKHVNRHPVIVETRLLFPDDKCDISLFEGGHVVLLGGELSLSCFRALSLALGVPYYHHDLSDGSRSLTRKHRITETVRYTPVPSDDGLVVD